MKKYIKKNSRWIVLGIFLVAIIYYIFGTPIVITQDNLTIEGVTDTNANALSFLPPNIPYAIAINQNSAYCVGSSSIYIGANSPYLWEGNLEVPYYTYGASKGQVQSWKKATRGEYANWVNQLKMCSYSPECKALLGDSTYKSKCYSSCNRKIWGINFCKA